MPEMTSVQPALAEAFRNFRRPGSRGQLKAWDAADELLIEQACRVIPAGDNCRVLVVDDQFGALTLGLEAYTPMVLADSAMLAESLKLNRIDLASDSPYSWLNPPAGPFDAVVMRIPRQLDYLAYILRWVNQVLSPSGVLLAGGMIKHLPDRSVDVFSSLVNTREVVPARRKARVVVCSPGEATLDQWPDLWRGYRLAEPGPELKGLPAVFARERLDIGTRLLLPEVSRAATELREGARILDLACGNGVLGVVALSRQPSAELVFADVSSQAIASAQNNLAVATGNKGASFHHSDGIPEGAGAFDLILLNPPFHEGGVVGDHIALRLFSEAARHLSVRGRLLLVGNRHLGYHRSLKRFFPRVNQLAADPKFVVFEAGF